MSKPVLPNFLIAGAEKGGTTWLHAQLRKHPDIFLPATKEVQFFNKYNSNFVPNDYFRYGLEWYGRFFEEHNGQPATGEATPMYICDAEAPERILKTLPGVKIIVMLRNPVQRAYSHYWMAKQKHHTTLCFKEVIEQEEPRFVKRGLYYQQLKTYFDLFRREQIMVLFYEEVFEHPAYWLSKVCRFLQVDESFFDDDPSVGEKVFEASAYKSPFLLNKQHEIVHRMRRNKTLSGVLNWLKQNGISDRVKKMNAVQKQYEPMAAGEAALLWQYYQEDMAALALLLNRELPFRFPLPKTT